MRHDFSAKQQRQIQNQQQFYDALAVLELLKHHYGGDVSAVLEVARAEDARCARDVLNDGGFWREVIRIAETG